MRSVSNKKIRVVVRQVMPRNKLKDIPVIRLNRFVDENYPKFEKILYIGWCRRIVKEKKELRLIASTGTSLKEARIRFKNYDIDNYKVWDIT
jgi:hypothetical protein